MEVIAIVLTVLFSVFFVTYNLLCCLCTGRGGGRMKQPPKKITTSIGSHATRDGNMVVLAREGGVVVGTATASGVMTKDNKRDRDNNISGGSGAAAVGGVNGTDNSGTNHGCCCGGGDSGGGGCGGCGGCGG
ncbi:uncharacterized protein LOC129871750 [Solanum dulcamara]|uniref:uncharacterized protein LOC129871750 n=1 Tax=Solanum dulcamara TaxID=45834 RepID=UPI002486366F|nr:uncharacterized protein LOC129871750 [Solanum dulcamara]